MLVQAAFEQHLWWLALIIVASSLLAVIYVWRLVEVLYLQKPNSDVTLKEVPMLIVAPMWVAAIACLYFGLDTRFILDAAATAAEGLMVGSAGMAEFSTATSIAATDH
jgi:multicomponent Na+:H+ antiporter subunit D